MQNQRTKFESRLKGREYQYFVRLSGEIENMFGYIPDPLKIEMQQFDKTNFV